MKRSKPVEAGEVMESVLRALARDFKGRHLDVATAHRGLALAGHELAMVLLREVAKPK